MTELIQKHRSDIEQLCIRHRVRKLEVFGSAADADRFDPQTSDLDFLVEFQAMPVEQYADAYFGLLEDLQTLFGRSVDLIMPEAIRNPYFLEKVNQSRKQIYAA
ncbi:MAG TPA: nucleotidyltransferase domain-containing protein [Acidobacteriota bacterium]|nr:nucleotidyltransferase domain-containing protein [Acidobacteriota bacterium]